MDSLFLARKILFKQRIQLLNLILVSAFLAIITMFLWACGTSKNETTPDPDNKEFNVILISIDTLRADRLGCYGYKKRDSSPQIDKFAKDSVLFENCITSSPWTTPAHMSMLTSLHPSSHGMTSSFGDMWRGLFSSKKTFFKLPQDRVTLAEVLKKNGFSTAAFTAGGPMEPVLGFGQGFDSYDTSMYKLYDENVGEMKKWITKHKKKQFFLFWHNFEVHAPYLKTDFLNDVLPADKAKIISDGMKEIERVPLKKVWPGRHFSSTQTTGAIASSPRGL